MVQKGDRIPCVVFEDGSVELFADFGGANQFMNSYLTQHAKKIIGTVALGPNCRTTTFVTRDGYESLISITIKVVG